MHKEESKFGWLVSMYPQIRRFCSRYKKLSAEDLAQEVALKLLRSRDVVPEGAGPSWIRTVVRNAAVDQGLEERGGVN